MKVYQRLALAGAIAAAATVPLGPAPAWADPPGLVVLAISTGATSNDKSLTVACPAGKSATGGGGYLNANVAARGFVGLDRLEPLANGSGFVATMRETDTYAGTWSMTAKAICVNTPAGWQRNSTTTAASSFSATATTPACPTGKSVIGTGARVNSGLGEVILDDLVPSADLKTVTARAYRVPGSAHDGWTLTAYAICANTPAGLERVSWDTGAFSSTAHQSVNWNCPDAVTPKGVYSGGYEIFGGNGNVMPSGLNPISTDQVSSWGDEFHLGYAGSWNHTVYLICGS